MSTSGAGGSPPTQRVLPSLLSSLVTRWASHQSPRSPGEPVTSHQSPVTQVTRLASHQSPKSSGEPVTSHPGHQANQSSHPEKCRHCRYFQETHPDTHFRHPLSCSPHGPPRKLLTIMGPTQRPFVYTVHHIHHTEYANQKHQTANTCVSFQSSCVHSKLV